MEKLETKKDIINIIQEDKWMMDVLTAAESLELPDWWIGAGFVRNKVWDVLSGFSKRTGTDIDVIFFDKTDTTKEREKSYETTLSKMLPNAKWTVKNMARMHLVNGDFNHKEYLNSTDGFSHWPETATCVGITKNGSELILEAPFGVDDIINMEVRANLKYPSPNAYNRRIREKNWKNIWPKLNFFDFNGKDITDEIKL